MKTSQKGFSIVEILIGLLVVGLIFGAGWYVWQNKDDNSSESSSSNQESNETQVKVVDSSNTFSIEYPSGWSQIPYEAPGYDGTTQPEPDWTKTPEPIAFQSKSDKNAVINIDGINNANTTIEKEIEAIDKDEFNTYTKVTINGYEAVKHVLDFVGPSEAEKYKDTTYIVLSNNTKVTFNFRESYSNVSTNGEYDFDATNLSSDFEKVVNSINFLNK